MTTKEKFNDSLNDDLFSVYFISKDDDVRNKIVMHNQSLVSYVLGKYYTEYCKHSPDTKQDMYQEGIMGLMCAIDKFDPSFGCKFSTYAVWWLRQKINNYLSIDSVIQVPNHIRTDQNKLFQQLNFDGKQITELNEEDYKKYNLSTKKLRRIKNALSSKKVVSIHSPIGSTSEPCTYEDFLEDDTDKSKPEDSKDKKNVLEAIKRSLINMPEKKRLVLLIRYGILSNDSEVEKAKVVFKNV